MVVVEVEIKERRRKIRNRKKDGVRERGNREEEERGGGSEGELGRL